MAEQHKPAPVPWQVPLAADDVAEDGRHFDLVADALSDGGTRRALSRS